MNNTNRNIKPISPFILFCQKVIPLAFDESMSYYECLCALTNYLYNEVIPAVNNNADAVTELQSYVANYFKNLDVQEEINNKLDEMAESGQLAEIISLFLNSNVLMCFNTVNDLKTTTELADGSFAKTSGKNTYNDGYGAFYKIRERINSDVPDDDNIIVLTNTLNLVAEKIFNQELINLNTKVTNILSPQNYKTKKYLLVGDSYAVGYQGAGLDNIEGFYTKLVNRLNLNAQIVCANGYGFLGINSNLKWQDLIQNTTIPNKDTFTDIIIAGGMNDRATDEVFETAMLTTFNYLKTNFPNANIHVACVGKYAKSTTQNLVNMRRAARIYKTITIRNGHKYVDGSEFLLHNMSWFISDNIHPNTNGETQLSYGFEQYIVNGQITNFMSITSLSDFQTDTIIPASDINLDLGIYSAINGDVVNWFFSGQINFENNITINNLSDIVIGNLSNSYICGSANNQGLNEYVEGYVYCSTQQYNNSPFVKVGFRLYNDNNNDIHLKAFTVSDDGNYKQLVINQITFPYGAIKCNVSSRYC